MAKEQDIFFKTPKQIKQEAKDTLKGSYAKSIKANLLGLAVLLGVALGFVLSLILLEDYLWLQVSLCVILATIFVFFIGTVLAGNLTFYNKLYKDDAKIKDAFSSFNNVWKYGRMFVYYLVFQILAICSMLLVFVLICIILISNLFTYLLQGDFSILIFAFAKYHVLLLTVSIVISIISNVISAYISVKYSMLFMTVAETPKQTLISAFKQNKSVMKGNKKRFLKLWFSMSHHYIFCVLSLGIYAIWFWPYYQTCKVVFYQDLIAEF